jgi:hypothetical protein
LFWAAGGWASVAAFVSAMIAAGILIAGAVARPARVT